MKYIALISLILSTWSCTEENIDQSDCSTKVIIDNTQYDMVESDAYELIDVSIDGNCLIANISSSGCDGLSWTLDLYDPGFVAESLPVQRFLKLSLSNMEECDAVITKTISFDISPLQISDNDVIILNLDELDEQLKYEY